MVKLATLKLGSGRPGGGGLGPGTAASIALRNGSSMELVQGAARVSGSML